MKSDIDKLMEKKGLDAAIVTGKVHGNPPVKYLTGVAGVTNAVLVKKRGENPILIHGTMEREEAALTGYELMDFQDFGYMEIAKKGKSPLETEKEFFTRIFERLGIRGKIGLYGRVGLSLFFPLMEDLQEELQDIEWIREEDADLFTCARLTKDREEVEAIRSVGRRTGEVIQEVVDLLLSADRKNGVLFNRENGNSLKIKDMKRFIALSLARKGLLEDDETIFSIGYDTAVPHNRGKDDDEIVIGEPIIFDIFPADARSGYHYDVTRSMVVGDPSEAFLRLYEDVKGAYELAESLLREGGSACDINSTVIEYFEQMSHPTLRRDGNFTDGYIHSLGHGIGLDVHENPRFGLTPATNDRLEKGMVFTIEPGLYYPERSIGVRIEDVFWINEGGIGERVVDIPHTYHID
jgi:Xaa-Pro aminopeptidase